MSRFVVFVACLALLSVSAVSAQQVLVAQMWQNSVQCNNVSISNATVVSSTGPQNFTTGGVCNTLQLPAAGQFYSQAWCNSTTGLIKIQFFDDVNCTVPHTNQDTNQTDIEWFNNNQCKQQPDNTTSVLYTGCDIIVPAATTLPPTTPTPKVNTTQAPNGTTIPPTATPTPFVNTTQPPVKGAAFQAGASLIAAAVAVIVSLF